MDFEKVFKFLLEYFETHNIRYALMGGFALHAAGYSRATADIDFLIHADDMAKMRELLLNLGYELIHESEDVSNYKGLLKELGQIDFVHARREYTRNMLKRAKEYGILKNKFKVRVLDTEDIIGLKIQASANDPKREARDWADIEQLLTLHHDRLDTRLLREYFSLFGLEHKLDTLLEKVKNA
ncbi:MAG: hypothetical protein A3C36_04045 [Omnitrophica WOR_2 bacterium RIFCSPHIGHO2_02_FULL_52_10]|nr:MAG: hypothetical protein A3C36_04045 [Omnitrophica WOR_2 bacterium RIFCSPHIGHO2_02_FULL_52_10]